MGDIYIYTHVCAHVCVCTHTCVYVHTYVCNKHTRFTTIFNLWRIPTHWSHQLATVLVVLQTHTHTLSLSLSLSLSLCVCVCVCIMHTYVCTYTHMCVHTHTCAHTCVCMYISPIYLSIYLPKSIEMRYHLMEGADIFTIGMAVEDKTSRRFYSLRHSYFFFKKNTT